MSFVGGASASNATTSSVTSLSVNYTPTPGNIIVLCLIEQNRSAESPFAGTTTWTVHPQNAFHVNATYYGFMWVGVATSGTTSIGVNFGGSQAGQTITVSEFSGRNSSGYSWFWGEDSVATTSHEMFVDPVNLNPPPMDALLFSYATTTGADTITGGDGFTLDQSVSGLNTIITLSEYANSISTISNATAQWTSGSSYIAGVMGVGLPPAPNFNPLLGQSCL